MVCHFLNVLLQQLPALTDCPASTNQRRPQLPVTAYCGSSTLTLSWDFIASSETANRAYQSAKVQSWLACNCIEWLLKIKASLAQKLAINCNRPKDQCRVTMQPTHAFVSSKLKAPILSRSMYFASKTQPEVEITILYLPVHKSFTVEIKDIKYEQAAASILEGGFLKEKSYSYFP